jgi:hypothetical protein
MIRRWFRSFFRPRVVRGWRTCDARPTRMFPDDEVESLLAELDDLEQRLDSFARRVQQANLRRPNNSRPGFYSPSMAMIGAISNTSWLGRVKHHLNQDRWLMKAFPPKVVPTAAQEDRV